MNVKQVIKLLFSNGFGSGGIPWSGPEPSHENYITVNTTGNPAIFISMGYQEPSELKISYAGETLIDHITLHCSGRNLLDRQLSSRRVDGENSSVSVYVKHHPSPIAVLPGETMLFSPINVADEAVLYFYDANGNQVSSQTYSKSTDNSVEFIVPDNGHYILPEWRFYNVSDTGYYMQQIYNGHPFIEFVSPFFDADSGREFKRNFETVFYLDQPRNNFVLNVLTGEIEVDNHVYDISPKTTFTGTLEDGYNVIWADPVNATVRVGYNELEDATPT